MSSVTIVDRFPVQKVNCLYWQQPDELRCIPQNSYSLKEYFFQTPEYILFLSERKPIETTITIILCASLILLGVYFGLKKLINKTRSNY